MPAIKLAPALLLALAPAPALAQSALTVTPVPIAAAPDPADKSAEISLAFSPDFSHFAYITGKSPRVHVVADGKPGPDFQDIPAARLSEAGRPDQLFFSPDSKHFAYVAAIPQGRVLVLDNTPGKPYDDIAIGRFAFSPDSRHLVTVATRDKKEMVLLDGVASTPYDYIEDRLPKFSPDSQHLYYIGRTQVAPPGEDRSHLIFDNQEIADYPHISSLTFSPDHAHYACVIRRGESWIVLYDGTLGPPFKDIGNELVFSADSKHFLYRGSDPHGNDNLVVDGKILQFQGSIQEAHYAFDPGNIPACYLLTHAGRFVVHGNDRFGPYDYTFGSLAFSPDARHLAFPIIEKVPESPAAPHGEQRRYIIDGKPQPPHDDLDDLQFSADSAHWLYTARRGKQVLLILDGQSSAPADSFRYCHFSPDGRHTAVIARRNDKDTLLYDQQELVTADLIYSYQFSPDSTRLAAIVHTHGRMLDNTEHGGTDVLFLHPPLPVASPGPFEELAAPTFTPDGRHVITVARAPNATHWQLLADTTLSSPFDAFPFPATFLFDSPTTFHTLALKDHTYYRLNCTLPDR